MKRRFPLLLTASAIALSISLGSGRLAQSWLNTQVKAEKTVQIAILWQVPSLATSATFIIWAFASLALDMRKESAKTPFESPKSLSADDRARLIIELDEAGIYDAFEKN